MNQTPAGVQAGNILVVDDTPASLRLLTQLLRNHGYEVRPVPDGVLALAAIQAQAPDLILLDIRMPGMDGYEVCARLKAEPRTRDIPVIFISALDELEDKVLAFASGGVDYVTKPFQVEEVLARVRAHLAVHQLQTALQEANRRMEQELLLAGAIQTSLLPAPLPQPDGWQLAAALQPARETSGDFYDAIPLPGGRLGLLVADVVDKGVKAALFMSLSWALLRTYFSQSPEQPALALAQVNNRILQDTRAGQFFSLFYAILDVDSGRLTYVNAGHNPPYWFGSPGEPRPLAKTGMLVGIFPEQSWTERTITMAAGDALLLYTDGVTDAENAAGQFYGEARLQAAAQTLHTRSAAALLQGILAEVRGFTVGADPFDDIAVITLKRER